MPHGFDEQMLDGFVNGNDGIIREREGFEPALVPLEHPKEGLFSRKVVDLGMKDPA